MDTRADAPDGTQVEGGEPEARENGGVTFHESATDSKVGFSSFPLSAVHQFIIYCVMHIVLNTTPAVQKGTRMSTYSLDGM